MQLRMLIKWTKLGGHVHCTVWVRNVPSETWQRSGNFILAAGAQFEDFCSMMENLNSDSPNFPHPLVEIVEDPATSRSM